MTIRKDIEAASAYIRLYVKGSEWTKGLNSAGKQLTDFGGKINGMSKKLAVAGAALAAPLVASVTQFASLGSQYAKVSKRLGTSTESLSELAFAAEKTGGEFSSIESIIAKSQSTLSAAAAGNLEAQVSFAKLGLSVRDLRKMSPDQVIEAIADSLVRYRNEADRVAVGSAVLGDGIADLLPLFAQGSYGIRELRKQARELGLTMDSQTAQSARELSEVFLIVTRVVRSLAVVIGSKLAAPLIKIGEWITKVVTTTRDWIDQNGDLVKVVAAVAAAIVVASAAAFALGGAIQFVGFTFFSMATIIKTVSAAMAILGSVASTVFSALISPIGIVVGLLVAVAAGVAYASGALNTLAVGWTALGDTAATAWSGIVAAIMSGDLALAGEIAMLGLQTAWMQVMTTMQEAWGQFTKFFTDTWQFAVDNATDWIVTGVSAMESAWVQTVAVIQNSWDILTAGLTSAWDVFIAYASEAAFQFGAFFQQLWADLVAIVDEESSNAMTTSIQQAKLARDNQKKERQKALDEKLKSNYNGMARSVTDREQNKSSKLDEIRAQRDGIRKTLNEDRTRRDGKNSQPNPELEAKKKELEAKKKELAALSSQAKAGKKPGDFNIPEFNVPGFDSAQRSVAKVSATGIFNSFASKSIGGDAGGNPMERTAKATEKTAKNTDEIRKQGGVAFT
jgi:hypothetical protein